MGLIENLNRIMASCVLCPRMCRVNRLDGEIGFCGIGSQPTVSSTGPHFGEEPPLVGVGGSGTVFFTGCNLGCVFCQNWEISHGREGRPITVTDLSNMMLQLQKAGCENINWVTPTHQVPAIMEALDRARSGGLALPTVFNCGGYERAEILRLLEGHVDVYMPDAKFARRETARRYAGAPDYPEVMKIALKEMRRQVGDLEVRNGIAVRGLLVRHLVMPGCVDESMAILDFIASEVSPDTYVNVMDQYRPAFRAVEFPKINRRTPRAEYTSVRDHALKLGLRLSN